MRKRPEEKGEKMGTNRNIVDMIEAIRKGMGSSANTGELDGIYMAEVMSVKPLTIKMHDLSISKNLYINPALLLAASDDEEDIKEPFAISFEPGKTFDFLKEFHEKYVLKKGDTVIVCMTGASFYIAGKAVKV